MYGIMERKRGSVKYAAGPALNFNPVCWLEADPSVTQHLRKWKYLPGDVWKDQGVRENVR